MTGIYKITNKINNKCYIGQSTNIIQRWRTEKYCAFQKNKKEYYSPLSCAFRKYGIDNFAFEVLEECLIEELNEKEAYWASYYHAYVPNGYNLAYCGQNGSISGCALSVDEVLQIISLLKTTDRTQEDLGKQFGVDGKTIQTINTGVHWHILPDADYPIRDRYFRARAQTASSEKPTIYDTLPSPIECLSRIAQYGFEQVCDSLKVCRATIKKHLATANLPTSKIEIVAYYNHHILCKQPKKPISKGKIQQIDIQTGEVLHTFNNGYEAGRYLGDENKRKHINEVCLGKRNSAYGYKWRRID